MFAEESHESHEWFSHKANYDYDYDYYELYYDYDYDLANYWKINNLI